MRRSELAGVDRDLLDLEDATLTIEDTRVVVAGHTIDSDGKSNAGVRTISIDTFRVELLRRYLTMLDDEREEFGAGYDTDHNKLMRYADGRRLHADTVTRRFNRLVDLAGLRRIRLHDVRHTFATRLKIYGHRSTGHDRGAAELVAGLIRDRLDQGPAADAG
ncbi:MAG: tyrosine-type recombinase/integrase [Pseudonocardia sp.]|nr:tyrosine-type recombinase/integrase [Pseudonocardia sp.]